MTESRELLYPWHPWFGQVVYIHEVAEERGARVFHCDLENKPSARCLTVPGWMFDRAVCLGMRRAEGPQVELAALVRLGTLLAEVANRASGLGTMIGPRHSFDHRGDADAEPESSATKGPTRSVPHAESVGAQLARPVGRARLPSPTACIRVSAIFCVPSSSRDHPMAAIPSGAQYQDRSRPRCNGVNLF